jgi:hypothetical protein
VLHGAGTDADVSIILFGQDGKKTGESMLADSANNFERGSVDEFMINLKVHLFLIRVMCVACARTALPMPAQSNYPYKWSW